MTPFERWSIRVTAALVTITGLVYAWMKYLLAPVEPWSAVNHPLQPLVLKLHILVAPLLVFALGMIAARHVWRHLRERVRNGRRSGWTLVLTAAAMIATGYLIQAVTHERWLFWLAMAHLATGIVFAVSILLHQARSTAPCPSHATVGPSGPATIAGAVPAPTLAGRPPTSASRIAGSGPVLSSHTRQTAAPLHASAASEAGTGRFPWMGRGGSKVRPPSSDIA